MTYEDPDVDTERDAANVAKGCLVLTVLVLLSILALLGVLAWAMF